MKWNYDLKKGDHCTLDTLELWFADAANRKRLMMDMSLFSGDSDTEDYVQDAYIKSANFVKRNENFVLDSNLSSWIYRITINLVTSHHRRVEFKTTNLDADDIRRKERTTHFAVIPDIHRIDIKRVYDVTLDELDKLDPRLHYFFTLYCDGEKYEEISNQLAIPLGTLKSLVNRGRDELRRKVNSK